MPYVRRNAEGRVIALFAEPDGDAQEFVSPDDAQVLAVLGRTSEAVYRDLDFVRVTEDLIHALIEKGVLNFMDLPQEARTKLQARESFRSRRVEGALDLLGRSDAS